MSKYVWAVEAKGDKSKHWFCWDIRTTRFSAEMCASRLEASMRFAKFRVAKYVRVEPKKGRK